VRWRAARNKGWRVTKHSFQAIESGALGRETRGWLHGSAAHWIDVDLLRERSLRTCFRTSSTQVHLEHHRPAGRVRSYTLEIDPTHVLSEFESVPRAFEITGKQGQV